MDDRKPGWLIVERKPKEGLLIGPDIEVSISKIRGNYVWLAVRAPHSVRVDRVEAKELPRRIIIRPRKE